MLLSYALCTGPPSKAHALPSTHLSPYCRAHCSYAPCKLHLFKPMPSKQAPLAPTFRRRVHCSYAPRKLPLFKPMPSKHAPLAPTFRRRVHCSYALYKLQLPLFKLTPSNSDAVTAPRLCPANTNTAVHTTHGHCVDH